MSETQKLADAVQDAAQNMQASLAEFATQYQASLDATAENMRRLFGGN